MADETASETTEQPPEAPVAPASPFNADGTFVENWQSMAPEGYEELREDKSLPRSKSLWELSRTHVNLRKKEGAEKMARPTDKWGDDDWNEFYNAGGRPSTAEDYNIQRHPDIPEEAMTDEMIAGFQKKFHEIGLSQKQKDALVAYNDELTLAKMESMAKEAGHNHDVMMDANYKEFGPATEQRTRWANGAIERGCKGSEELRAFVQEKMNTKNDIVFWTTFLSNIESNFAEHGEFADPHIDSPKDVQAQITELEKDPRLYNSTLTFSERKVLTDRIIALREKLTKGAVVGQAAQQ